MVDAFLLTNDIVQTVLFFALPPLVWLFLFLLAWERGATAGTLGVDRVAFWALLPGALIGSFANLPLLPIGRDVLALNVGGGFVPVALSLVLIAHAFGRPRRTLTLFLGAFAVEALVALAVVLAALSALATAGGLVVAAVVPPVLLSLRRPAEPEEATVRAHVAVLLALSGAALVATYVSSSTVIGLGIVSSFPYYLLVPVGVGAGSVLAVRRLGLDRAAAATVAYASATFGVLVGADVLRQPPLYANGGPALYSIGGAGLLDLLYLTGLLALVSAVAFSRMYRRWPALVRRDVPDAPRPYAILRTALLDGVRGRAPLSVDGSVAAVRAAIAQARHITHLGLAPADRPWAGILVPPWVEADTRNLLSLPGDPTLDRREAARAYITARGLVKIAGEVARPGFGTVFRRVQAFILDLVVITLPAVLVWAVLSATLPGSLTDVLSGVPFNAAVFGYASYGFAYFALAEYGYGTTLGKRWAGLQVTDRSLARPSTMGVIVRDLPKLIPLTFLGVGLSVVLLFVARGITGASGSATIGGAASVTLAVTFLAVGSIIGVVLCGLASLLGIYATAEHQRLGDLLAGTWVMVRTATTVPAGAQVPAPMAPAAPTPTPSG